MKYKDGFQKYKDNFKSFSSSVSGFKKHKIKKVKYKNIFQFFSSQLAEKPAIDSVSKITIRVSHRVQKQLCESEREEEWGLSSAEAGSTALQRIKGEFLFSAES